jgi:hypothetical protein
MNKKGGAKGLRDNPALSAAGNSDHQGLMISKKLSQNAVENVYIFQYVYFYSSSTD